MIEPKQIIRTNRRSLALTIDERGELIVHAPKSMPLYQIIDFIDKKQSWISTKTNQLNSVLQKNKYIVNYEEIFFLGKRYKVVETIGVENPYITNQTLLIENTKNINKKKQTLRQWYMMNTEQILIPRIQKLSQSMKLDFSSIKIINSKAKWGMCDSKRNLYFNWKLLMLSAELIDYVIIHELSHILEMNHSSKFWEIVKSVLPNFAHSKEVLSKCGFLIKLY